MTKARVKGERWNKVKLRGQRIPGINTARKVSLRDSFYIQKRKKRKEKETEGRKGGRKGTKGRKGGKGGREEERKRNQPNPLLLHRVYLVNVPVPPGRLFNSGGDPFAK